jgi:hypothetical protein
MRRSIFAFWMVFWFAALFGVPAIALTVGASLAFWFDFPEGVMLVSPFVGWVVFFGLVGLFILLDGRPDSRTGNPLPWWAFWRKIAMSRSTKRLIRSVFVLLGFLMILNPGYRWGSVAGPTGVIRTKKFTLWSTNVSTRVVADESSVQIEHD